MKNLLLLLLPALMAYANLSGTAAGQDLAVSNIPESLMRGANSVVREHEAVLSLTSEGSYNYRESLKLTILNEKALDLAHLKIFYNKGDRINIRTAAIFDASGVRIKTIRLSEENSYSTAGDYTMYSDLRAIFHKIVPSGYPFTIYFDYDITYSKLYLFKTYFPYMADNQSIVSSTLKVINPSGIPLNIKKQNLPESTLINESGHSGTWQFSNLPPLFEEPLRPPPQEFLPIIRVSSERLEFNNFIGKADSWENYGKWLALLSAGRKSLSQSTVSHLNQLVRNASTQREKTRIIYKYLQSRTHYISISLGIGSIQPHEASAVDELGYGDCKDLSNYMVTMLDAVGVKSYYTVVNSGAGQYSFQADQPGHQFDHAIVCVPMETDTIWLECTSQINPFGHLGGFTDNRHVLIIKDNTGVLAKTPEYTIDENFNSSTFTIDHSDDGTSGSGTIRCSGLLMDDEVAASAMNMKDQIEWVNENLEINDFTLIRHQFLQTEDPQPVIRLDVELALKSFFTGSNGRLFANLNLNNSITALPRVRSRRFPLNIPISYHTCDTLVINLPPGYKPEQLPVASISDERFGSYSIHTVFEANSIRCIRKYEIYKGSHAPEVYAAFYDFMQKAAIADSRQLVLTTEP